MYRRKEYCAAPINTDANAYYANHKSKQSMWYITGEAKYVCREPSSLIVHIINGRGHDNNWRVMRVTRHGAYSTPEVSVSLNPVPVEGSLLN